MEVFLLLLVIVVIILLITNQSSLKNQLTDITRGMNLLYKEINSLKKELDEQRFPAPAPIPEEEKIIQSQPVRTVPPEPVQEPESISPPLPEMPVIQELPATAGITPPAQEEIPAQPAPYNYIAPGAQQPVAEEPGLWERWIKNNPDLEKFIGENLVNKIGIGILVLGIAFFVKYAIDKEWINEAGRVGIGLLCGAILVGIGHRLHKAYRSFSSVLAGGGIAVFYFTIAFAFHQYHLLSQTVAFVAMILITIFTVLLSLRYDRLELAIIATVGGFLTPFLVSTGSGNYIVLFTYLLILNSGIAILAYFKRWTPLNIISLVFTQIIFGSWMGKTITGAENNGKPPFPGANAFGFATAFYLLFLATNIINQLRYKKTFRAIDFSIILLLTGSYFAAGIISLDQIPATQYKGLFTFSLAMLQLLLILFLRKREGADKNLQYLLYGLTVTFATLAIPIQFDGRVITMFWLAEFVLMLWLYLRMRMPVFQYASMLIMLMACISLFSNWSAANAGSLYNLPVIFTDLQGIMTNITAIAAFIAAGFVLHRYRKQEPVFLGIPATYLSYGLWTAGAILIYITAIFSVNLIFARDHSFARANTYHLILTFTAALLAMMIAQRKGTAYIRNAARITVTCICFLLYASGRHAANELFYGFREGQIAGFHFGMHWLAAGLLLWIIYYAIRQTRKEDNMDESLLKTVPWLYATLLLVIFSFECLYLFLLAGKNSNTDPVLRQQFYKAGLSVLWGLCSFAMMWLGMRHKFKPLRIISLSLFSVVLVKLFLYDIRNISETGKIIAFILLGVLLLLISFMYQKLKKIIIDDKKKETEETQAGQDIS